MDRRDIINAIRDIHDLDDFKFAEKDFSLTRLHTLGVPIGAARQENHAGANRHYINQNRMGVVSLTTLKDILRRRLEHLWSCLMCNEDDL